MADERMLILVMPQPRRLRPDYDKDQLRRRRFSYANVIQQDRDRVFFKPTLGETMNTRYLITAIFLGITACATTGPEAPEPASITENADKNADTAVVENQLEVVDVPEVPDSANVPPADKVICHKERRTGTYLAKKVCRTQARMDAEREAGQNTLDNLSRRTFSGPGRDSKNE